MSSSDVWETGGQNDHFSLSEWGAPEKSTPLARPTNRGVRKSGLKASPFGLQSSAWPPTPIWRDVSKFEKSSMHQ